MIWPYLCRPRTTISVRRLRIEPSIMILRHSNPSRMAETWLWGTGLDKKKRKGFRQFVFELEKWERISSVEICIMAQNLRKKKKEKQTGEEQNRFHQLVFAQRKRKTKMLSQKRSIWQEWKSGVSGGRPCGASVWFIHLFIQVVLRLAMKYLRVRPVAWAPEMIEIRKRHPPDTILVAGSND